MDLPYKKIKKISCNFFDTRNYNTHREILAAFQFNTDTLLYYRECFYSESRK